MSEHQSPLVSHVLYIGQQRHPWQLAPIERLRTRYHTPTTVSTEFGTIDPTVKPQAGKKAVSKQQTQVYCLADDAAYQRAQVARAALQQSLDALAAGLRQLGSYARQLEAAGGVKAAPNPLSATVIEAEDPDDTNAASFYDRLVPQLGRKQLTSHTPKMLHIERDGKPWSTSHQRDHFVCPSDAAWEQLQALHGVAEEAAQRWRALLKELGTYDVALADGRYRQPIAVPYLELRVPLIGPAQSPTASPTAGPATPVEKPPVFTTLDEEIDWYTTRGRWADAQAFIDSLPQGAKSTRAYLAHKLAAAQRTAGVAAATPASPAPRASWPSLTTPLVFGHHRNATAGGVTHIWRPAPTPRSRQRHTTLCHITMTEPPHTPNWSQAGLRLCTECRQAAAALPAAETEESTMPMSEPATDVAAAISQLRARGWLVRAHGLHWLCARPDGQQPTVYTADQLLAAANTLPQRLCTTHQIAETDLDTELLDQLQDEGWTWQSAVRTPDGHWHHLVRRHGGEQRRLRRERLAALLAPATQLALSAPPIAGVVMMDASEARACLSAIQAELEQAEAAERSARQKLLDWKEREGWRALGHTSFVAGVQAEIGPWGKAHIYRLLGAAQIERILGLDQSPMGDSGDSEVPERQLRELLPLLSDPAALRAAWQQANERAGGATRTTTQVRQAVREQLVPIRRITDAALFALAEPTISIGESYLDKQRIKRPFSYDGKLWIGTGAAYGLAEGDRCNCVRVVLAGESYAPGEAHPGYRRGAYSGTRASAGGKEYELTGQWLIVTRPKEALLAESDAATQRVAATDTAPKSDAGRVAAIRRYLEQQRQAGQIFATETFEAAFKLASDIHDGDTWRAICAEIQTATKKATTPALSDLADVTEPVVEQPSVPGATAEALKAQARERVTALLRTGFARLSAETLVLRLLALALCEREQRTLIADMPRAELEQLLLGRIFAHCWSGDATPLLALLQLEAPAQPAPAAPAPIVGDPLVPIRERMPSSDKLAAITRDQVPWYVRNLAFLRRDLEALSGDPTVDDAAYEEVSVQLGVLQQQLVERLATTEEVAA